MKKSSFLLLILTVIGAMLFSLGMCMTLITEWNYFKEGIILGVVGIVVLTITLIIHRKLSGKTPIKISLKTVGTIFISIIGALLLGIGMCFCMVWEKIILGTFIGLIGIITLLFLIPYIKGFKD